MFCGYVIYLVVGLDVLIYRNRNFEKYIEIFNKIIWVVIVKYFGNFLFIFLEQCLYYVFKLKIFFKNKKEGYGYLYLVVI